MGLDVTPRAELDVWRDYRFEGKSTVLNFMDFPDGSEVKNGPAMRETQGRSLGGRHFLEKEMATHSSIFALKIQWTEEASGLQSMGSQKGRTCLHDWAYSLKFRKSGGKIDSRKKGVEIQVLNTEVSSLPL